MEQLWILVAHNQDSDEVVCGETILEGVAVKEEQLGGGGAGTTSTVTDDIFG
jgi:hypothetical protein